ncbi:MAG: anti-sigma factor antagonist, partial [Clostridia bacterium]|nr:anti-sigma factor antagonist [Clostridia bacterium]
MNLKTNFSEDHILTIYLEGDIDSATAAEAEARIMDIYQSHDAKAVVLDAENLRYVSSSGLRVFLKLRKMEQNLKLINASSEVYDILEMTGFTDLFPVSKAYRKINLEECTLLGAGGHGKVFRINDDTIVKMFYTGDPIEDIEREKDYAKKAFVMGIPTAIPFDIVKSEDMYGLVFELVDADIVSNYLNAHPDQLENIAKQYAQTMKQLHTTHVAKGALGSTKELYRNRIEGLRAYMTDDEVETLLRINEAIPESDTVVHGDYHPKNIMIQNGELILIDMADLTTGHPLYDLGSMALTHQIPSDGRLEQITGMKAEMVRKLWQMFLANYLGTDDPRAIEMFAKKISVVGLMKMAATL